MDKMKFETPNLTAENLKKLSELFPGVVTEGKVNVDLLRSYVGEEIFMDEAYEFTWVGKRAAIAEAGRPIRKTLRPVVEDETIPTGADSTGKPYCSSGSRDWDTTENLYIEGDNLDVLKLLQESYLGKVKMIYIDPPYNTGNDFIYRDNFSQSREEYDEEAGAFDENGERLFKNMETNGQFHSDWCSMMYPRLVLARNLLSDDGVIFISIDDGEVSNLKKICDEVLGASNFVGAIIRKVMEGGKSDSTGLAIEHEYCLCYGKQGSSGIYKRTSEHLEHYNKKDKYFEERGYYYLKPLENGGLGYVPTLDYPIAGPNGVDIYPGDFYGDNGYRWVWGKEKFNRALDLDMIEFTISQKDKSKYKVYYKIYEKVDTDGNPSVKTLPFPSLYLDGYTNRQAINDLKRVFDNIRVFDYPKPLSFLQELCRMASKDDAIVMDFFSGSAGLAQATMQLNAEDGGCRKFIMVQLPEVTDEKSEAFKAGYKNICEIGKERIRRAGDKIKAETGLTAQNLDIGFRVLKLDDTNMNDVYYAAGDYTQDLILQMESNIKPDRNDMDLLFGCLLDWGLPLSMPHTHEKIDGFTVHTYNDGDLIACFEERISEKAIREIANRKPLRAVFRDSSFSSSPEKINVFEIFKLLAPNTSVKVI